MKRDAVILVVATIILTVLAYQARPTDKVGITAVYAVSGTEIAIDSEETEVMATKEAQVGFVMSSSIWDKVRMTFYSDGSCVFEMPEYEVYEQCKWTYEEGVLNVVREDGRTFTSYIGEDGVTLKLDYSSLTHEKLVGQLDSLNYKEFFEE